MNVKDGESELVFVGDEKCSEEKKKNISLEGKSYLEVLKKLSINKLHFFYFNAPILLLLCYFVESQVDY